MKISKFLMLFLLLLVPCLGFKCYQCQVRGRYCKPRELVPINCPAGTEGCVSAIRTNEHDEVRTENKVCNWSPAPRILNQMCASPNVTCMFCNSEFCNGAISKFKKCYSCSNQDDFCKEADLEEKDCGPKSEGCYTLRIKNTAFEEKGCNAESVGQKCNEENAECEFCEEHYCNEIPKTNATMDKVTSRGVKYGLPSAILQNLALMLAILSFLDGRFVF